MFTIAPTLSLRSNTRPERKQLVVCLCGSRLTAFIVVNHLSPSSLMVFPLNLLSSHLQHHQHPQTITMSPTLDELPSLVLSLILDDVHNSLCDANYTVAHILTDPSFITENPAELIPGE